MSVMVGAKTGGGAETNVVVIVLGPDIDDVSLQPVATSAPKAINVAAGKHVVYGIPTSNPLFSQSV
jgi:hypothetical protein